MNCLNCNQEIDKENEFCSNCGSGTNKGKEIFKVFGLSIWIFMTIFFVVYIGKTIEQDIETEKQNNVEESQSDVDIPVSM